MSDLVRVLRVLEYVGPRERVEETVARSIQGERNCGLGLVIRAATVGTYPEILQQEVKEDDNDRSNSRA